MIKKPVKQVTFSDDLESTSQSSASKRKGFGFLHKAKHSQSDGSIDDETKPWFSSGVTVPQPYSSEHKIQNMLRAFSKMEGQTQNIAVHIDSPDMSAFEEFPKSDLATDVKADCLPVYGSRRPKLLSFVDKGNPSPKLMVKGPLGVCYDEVLKDWLITDTLNNKVISIMSNKSFRDGLYRPSAVAIYKEGISFIVLDSKRINMYTHEGGSPRVVANLPYQARGIAVTTLGNIITVQQETEDKYSQHIVVYSGAHCDQVVYRLKYDCGKSPSFIDYYDGKLSITDLSTQTATMYHVLEEDNNVSMKRINVLHRTGPAGNDPNGGCFKYVSGILHDENEYRLIADAEQQALYLFDQNGPLQRISCLEALPYTSGLWVNQAGRVALCDRRGNTVKFYQLIGTAKEMVHVAVTSSHGTSSAPSSSQEEESW